jgi:Sigma-70, region 4
MLFGFLERRKQGLLSCRIVDVDQCRKPFSGVDCHRSKRLRSVTCQEDAVINAHTNKQPLNRVTAMFADGSRSFLLPQDATLSHIADRIDDLGTRHEQPAIAVVVKLAPTPLQGSAPKLPDAFRDGLLAELPQLRAFARSLARNPDRADDLVQETLAKAWVAPFLVGVSGLSYDEAARIGGCAVGTIKSRVSRARQILLHKLGGWNTPNLPAGDGGGGHVVGLNKKGCCAFRGAPAPMVSPLPDFRRLHQR